MSLWNPLDNEAMLCRFRDIGEARHVYDCEALVSARDAGFACRLSFFVPAAAENREDYLALITWQNGDREAEIGTDDPTLFAAAADIFFAYAADAQADTLVSVRNKAYLAWLAPRFQVLGKPMEQLIFGVCETPRGACDQRVVALHSTSPAPLPLPGDATLAKLPELAGTLSGEERVFAFLSDGVAVGYLHAERCFERYFDLVYVYTAPAFRKQSVAGALCRSYVDSLSREGLSAHFGRADNAASAALAQKEGFPLVASFCTAQVERN